MLLILVREDTRTHPKNLHRLTTTRELDQHLIARSMAEECSSKRSLGGNLPLAPVGLGWVDHLPLAWSAVGLLDDHYRPYFDRLSSFHASPPCSRPPKCRRYDSTVGA
jgi:hypothetical protein